MDAPAWTPTEILERLVLLSRRQVEAIEADDLEKLTRAIDERGQMQEILFGMECTALEVQRLKEILDADQHCIAQLSHLHAEVARSLGALNSSKAMARAYGRAAKADNDGRVVDATR